MRSRGPTTSRVSVGIGFFRTVLAAIAVGMGASAFVVCIGEGATAPDISPAHLASTLIFPIILFVGAVCVFFFPARHRLGRLAIVACVLTILAVSSLSIAQDMWGSPPAGVEAGSPGAGGQLLYLARIDRADAAGSFAFAMSMLLFQSGWPRVARGVAGLGLAAVLIPTLGIRLIEHDAADPASRVFHEIGFAALFASVATRREAPSRGEMASWPGSDRLRWLFCFVVAPSILFACCLAGYRLGFYGSDALVALVVVATIALTSAVLGQSACRIDVAEQKRVEAVEKARNVRAHLDAIVHSMPIAVLAAEAPSGRLVLSNAHAQTLWSDPSHTVSDIQDYLDGHARRPDGRRYSPQEWPLARAIRTGRPTIGEEITVTHQGEEDSTFLLNAAALFDCKGAVVGAVAAFTDISDSKAAASERLRLLRRLVRAQEEERLRIARELHDQLGQDLTILSLDLKNFEPGAQTPARLDAIRRSVHQMSIEVHRVASELRPIALSDLGLQGALAGLIATWVERLGLAADTDIDAIGACELHLDNEAKLAVYRVVQEAMTNMARHARATAFSVTAVTRDGSLHMTIEDNGIGFVDRGEGEPVVSHGISGMRDRLALVGGALTVETAPGRGVTLRASVPMRGPVLEEGA